MSHEWAVACAACLLASACGAMEPPPTFPQAQRARLTTDSSEGAGDPGNLGDGVDPSTIWVPTLDACQSQFRAVATSWATGHHLAPLTPDGMDTDRHASLRYDSTAPSGIFRLNYEITKRAGKVTSASLEIVFLDRAGTDSTDKVTDGFQLLALLTQLKAALKCTST